MPSLKLSTAASYRIAFILIIGFQAVLLAYTPLYFSFLGYSPFEVSLISGLENIAGILGPALLVARTYPAGLGITILSGVSGLLMFFLCPYFGTIFLAGIWFLSLFFNRGVFVLINEEAQVRDREGRINYSESRSWGSGSFLLTMYGLGLVAERFGISITMTIGALMLVALAGIGLNLRERAIEQSHRSVISFLRNSFQGWHFIFYLAVTLIWASHGPAYTYMSIHLVNLGWTTSEIAISWNIAIITEIFVFLIFKKIQEFASLESFLTLTQLACILRWTIIASTSNPILITLSQILHGLTFGLCFVVSQKLLISKVNETYRKPAIALYFAATLGMGSLFGKLVAGWATRSSGFNGDYRPIFMLGTYMAVASLCIWCCRAFMAKIEA